MEQQDLTDRELAEIVRKKQEQIKNYRRKRGDPRPLKETLTAITRNHKGKKKTYKKNKRDLPGKEFFPITNQFAEAVYKQYLRPNETKVLWLLLRKTWGWGKKSDFIALKEFKKELDISKDEASKALFNLRKRRIVAQLSNKMYRIQTDLSLWHDRPKKNRPKRSR